MSIISTSDNNYCTEYPVLTNLEDTFLGINGCITFWNQIDDNSFSLQFVRRHLSPRNIILTLLLGTYIYL